MSFVARDTSTLHSLGIALKSESLSRIPAVGNFKIGPRRRKPPQGHLPEARFSFFTQRCVPRKTGLAILEAVNGSETAMAASTLANVLRGAGKSSYVVQHPELLTLTQFGAEKGQNYNEVLMDVLAMWAKGYLLPSPDQNKRLVLSQKGKETLCVSSKAIV